MAATTLARRCSQAGFLVARLASDPLFTGIDLEAAMETRGLAGRAAEQVEDFVHGAVHAALADCPARAAESALKV